MRLSISKRLSFEGTWQEESPQDFLKTKFNYKLFDYGQLVNIRTFGVDLNEIVKSIKSIENIEWYGDYYNKIEDKKLIKEIIENLDITIVSELSEEMLKDSTLSESEFRKLEYITYYLNWKADEFSRRKSYSCNDCRKFHFLDTRLCYLEESEFELPILKVVEKENDERIIEEDGVKMTDIDEFLQLLDELTLKHPDLSTFEVGVNYFSRLEVDGKKGYIELCPEAIRIKSNYLAEIFEMETRTSEYHVFPFGGSQIDQPALIIEAFDAIRMGRNMFHSQKMKEVSNKSK